MTQSRLRGFTLIELMIVVAIVAILAAVAYPSYQDSVLKTRRAEGQALLLSIVQAQERHFSQFARYASSLIGGPSTTQMGWSLQDLTSENGYYKVSLTASAPTTFTLQATPQQGDSKCGNLTLTSEGVKGSSKGSNDLCW